MILKTKELQKYETQKRPQKQPKKTPKWSLFADFRPFFAKNSRISLVHFFTVSLLFCSLFPGL